MSRFTGKCDLYDEVYMIGSDGASDEERFEAFREATGGVIHQEVQVRVTKFNGDMLVRALKGRLERSPDGKASHYVYLGTAYRSLKSLNRDGGVWVDRPIRFSTMMELLPYYGHIVSMMYSSEGRKVVFISDRDYSLTEDIECAEYGVDMDFRRSSRTEAMLAEEAARIAGEGMPAPAAQDRGGDCPYARHLDGTYVRVPRNGHTESVCLTDLSQGELEGFLSWCGRGRLRDICLQLAKDLSRAGDEYSLEAGDNGD